MSKISFFVFQIFFLSSIAHADGTLVRPGSFPALFRSVAVFTKDSSGSGAFLPPVIKRAIDSIADLGSNAVPWLGSSALIFKLRQVFQQNLQKANEIETEANRREKLWDEISHREKSWGERWDERNQRIKELREKILERRFMPRFDKDKPSEEDMKEELHELLTKPSKTGSDEEDEESDIAGVESGPGTFEQPAKVGNRCYPQGWVTPGHNTPSVSGSTSDTVHEAAEEVKRSESPLSLLVTSGLATVTDLESTFEIKRLWVHNEWHERCQFSGIIRKSIPDEAIFGSNKEGDKKLIESTFDRYRGVVFDCYQSQKGLPPNPIWGLARENAKWKRVVVENLELTWALENIEICYPSGTDFEISRLDGLVLWKDPTRRQYQLFEGNHRVSTWCRSKKPTSLPAVIFVGETKCQRDRAPIAPLPPISKQIQHVVHCLAPTPKPASVKQHRIEGGEIPFEGPSSRRAWTGGVPATTSFGVRILAPTIAMRHLPAGQTWEPYDIGEQMALRPAGDMTMPQWASMGMWSRNLFGLLFALSARVPDFAIAAYWNSATSEMALVVQKEDVIFVEVAYGPSKTKAKQAVADKIIQSADIWVWIRTKYLNTACDQYLK